MADNSNTVVTLKNIDAINHTTFVRKLVDRYVPYSDRRHDLINRIESIEKRAKDPFLYLAVIGEFDSGKSTFINGMLRQRLLKSSLEPTTASITQISPGNKFIVTVDFVDGTAISAFKDDFKDLERKIREIKPDLEDFNITDLNCLLDLLTSEKSVANAVKNTGIKVPSNNLMSNVSIIDTPGINAGAEYAEEHEKITVNVVDNIADAAIILIPSYSPMTANLIQFLDNKARHFLHRCIFVVTAMDKQSEEERNHIIDFVKKKLADKLNLFNPIVLQSSAIAMIPVKNIPNSMQDSWEYWQDQFRQIEAIIKQKMIQQRRLIISEHSIRLLQELNKDLNIELEEKRNEYKKEEFLLKQTSVESIERLLGIFYDESSKRITKEISSVKSQINSDKNINNSAAKAKVISIIDSNTGLDVKNYNTKIAPKINNLVKKQGQTYVESTEYKLNTLREVCYDICDDFGSKFEESYSNLPFLGAKIDVPSLSVPAISISTISVPEASFSLSKDKIDKELKSSPLKEIVEIASILAFVLYKLHILDLVVVLIPMIIVYILYFTIIYIDKNLTLKEAEDQFRSSVVKETDHFFAQYEKQITRELERINNEILSQLKNSVDSHIKEYYLTVKDLIETHEKKEASLKKDIQQINLDISELASRNKKLEDLKKVLVIQEN